MKLRKRTTIAAAGVVVAAAAATGTGVAVAGGNGETGSTDYSPSQAAAATKAALEATHGGHANSVERDGENGATWEVEVTRTDGTTVDVRLDENYQLVVIEGDSDSGETGGQ